MVTPAAYFWPFPLTSLIGCWHNYILIHITYILLYPCPEWVTGQDPYPKKKELVTTVPLWTSCYLKVKCTWLRIPRSHYNMSCGPVCCWANIATRHVNVFTFWQSSIYIYMYNSWILLIWTDTLFLYVFVQSSASIRSILLRQGRYYLVILLKIFH